MKQLPNALSAARLALAPYLFFLLWRRDYAGALAVCILAGVTDGLDGLLARKLGAHSRIGAYLDPLADKILLSGAFLTLALTGTIAVWLAALVLGRDALILAAAAVFAIVKKRRDFPPTIWGKASTTAQIFFILMLLIQLGVTNGAGDFVIAALLGWIVNLLQWLVAALAVWSTIDYAGRMFRRSG